MFGLLTGNRIEREFRRTYANLKRLLETGTAAVPARSPEFNAFATGQILDAVDDAVEPGGQLATS